ncbi:MAG: response regulator [Cytophagaceae bacterium]|nr:response regulator [Gemmatimonadaceae bacterium]
MEDDPSVRSIAVRALRDAGYVVLEADNGASAMEVVAGVSDDIALLITDLVMPLVGGRELARRLVALRPGLRVLFTSGYTENAIAHNGELDSGIAFLQKPYVGITLTQKVRAVLDAEQAATA